MPKNKEETGRQASIEGFANEKIVCGLLMKKYGNVSLVDLPLSSYDIVIARKKEEGPEDIIRVQSKTAKKSVSFIGGGRGGVDRSYKSGVKTYIQTPKHSDCIVGLHFEDEKPELFFVPTHLVGEMKNKKTNQPQKSISIKKIKDLKNNYAILENCKNKDFVIQKSKEYGIIP